MNSFLNPIELQTPAKGEFCSCFCLSLLPGLGCSIHATWEPPFIRALNQRLKTTCSRRSSPCPTRPTPRRMAPSAPAVSPCPPVPSATSPSHTRSHSDAGRPRRPESRTARETTEIIACVMGKCCHVQSHVSHIVNPSYPLCVTALCTESSRYGLAMRKPKANQ